jgi:hypothetical protein
MSTICTETKISDLTHTIQHTSPPHTFHQTPHQYSREGTWEEMPHHCLSTFTWVEEEDEVYVGLEADDEVLEFVAQPKEMLIGEAVYREGRGDGDRALSLAHL